MNFHQYEVIKKISKVVGMTAQKIHSHEHLKRPADFETAISVAGFGRFNIFLLLVACPAAMASVVETAVVSYILPSAECDLNLDLIDKGILNAITYVGKHKIFLNNAKIHLMKKNNLKIKRNNLRNMFTYPVIKMMSMRIKLNYVIHRLNSMANFIVVR